MKRHLLILVLAGLLCSSAVHAEDDCKKIVAALLAKQPGKVEWSTSPFRANAAEAARLHAAQTINALSITVERFKAGNGSIHHYRILASSDEPAVHAYSYEGAVDFISAFANQANTDQQLMIYLENFPSDQSLSLRQTLGIHLKNEKAIFLEAGPNVRPEDLPPLVKRHPLLKQSKISGVISGRDEIVLSATAAVKESASPLSIRVIIKVQGAYKTLNDVLARLLQRFTQVLMGLPANADLQFTAFTVQRELERELALIAKEAGIEKQDLKVQLAMEANDIYFSFPDSFSLPAQYLAMNECGDVCNMK